ncbi:MAG: HAD-IA family hydrolase [Rhodospirillales bacterium]
MSTGIKLVVFDCDGTLVDSQYAITACMTDAFENVGLEAPSIAEVRKIVGLPLAQAIGHLVSNDNAPLDAMVAAYSKSWQKMRAGGTLDEPLFEGTQDLLEQLKSAYWTLGIATGKSMRGLQATLDHHRLGAYFSTLQTADRARGKPDPEMLHLAMTETGAEPADTLMIGDTTYDIDMAVAAGVRAVGVAWGYHAPEELMRAGAVHVADDIAALTQFFNDLKE